MKLSPFKIVVFLAVLCGFWFTAADKSINAVRTVPLTSCFSEGLAISNGTLYQSCGGHYDSNVRILDLQTGVVLHSIALPPPHFGEGLTIAAGQYIFVITWTTHTLFIFRSTDLTLLGTKQFYTTTGEGWGLTTDGRHLIMSDGSDTITFFEIPNHSSFHVHDELVKVRSMRVYYRDRLKTVTRINELEYVDGCIYANMWRSDTMLKFDSRTGEITQTFNLSALAEESARLTTYLAATEFRAQDVGPNGIAYNEADNTFVLAGKLWPHCYVTHLQVSASTEEKETQQQSARSHRMFGLLVLVCLLLLWLLAMFHGLCHNCCFAGTSFADSNFPYEPV